MSSFRSHLRQHPQHHAPSQEQPRPKQGSRIPTKQSPMATSKPGPSAPADPRMAKRASLNVSLRSQPSKSPSLPAQPATVARSPSSPSQRPSVAHSPATSSRHSMLPPPTVIRTPSLASGSSASTFDSPRSALRRKPSEAIDRYAAQRRAEKSVAEVAGSTMHHHVEMYSGDLDDSVLGILPPISAHEYLGSSLHVDTGLGYNARHSNSGVSFNVTPPVPLYAQSLTPSTRYSDSPFSHAPTPSSASSYSSGIPAASEGSLPQRRPSPTRERLSSKDEAVRLTPVRESSTSSSNQTVKSRDPKSPPVQVASSKGGAVTSASKASDLRSRPSRNRLRKEQTNSSAAKERVQRPPELAHLDTDVTPKSPRRPQPPRRPSRDGASSIVDMNRPSPVVQSDLPRLYTSYHKRTPSQDTPVSASSPSFKARFGLASKSSSRTASPRVDSAVSPPPAARAFARGPTPENQSSEINRLQRMDSPAVGSNPSSAKSPRFGFFSRKSKSENAKPVEKPPRQAAKGPAAGTGHEGYGRFGYRGRSGSVSGSSGVRSPSTDSSTSNAPRPQPTRGGSLASKSGSDLDDFLLERLNPVVLRGSGTGSTTSSSTWSSDPQGSSLKHVPSNVSSASFSKPQLLPSAMRKTEESSSQKRPLLSRQMSSDTSDDGLALPFQDTANPSRLGHGRPSLGTNAVESTAGGKHNTGSTEVMHAHDAAVPGNEGAWLRSAPTNPIHKPSRKFSFFQRAQPSPQAKAKASIGGDDGAARMVPAQVSAESVPQYGILNSVQPVGLDEVERLVLDAEISHEDSMSESSMPLRLGSVDSRRHSLLSPPIKNDLDASQDPFAESNPPKVILTRLDSAESPEVLKAQAVPLRQSAISIDIPRSPHDLRAGDHVMPAPVAQAVEASRSLITPEPKVLLDTPEPQIPDESPRPPRLSPVGRIPRVVSKRDRDRKLPDNSFSRPFVRNQPKPSVKPPGSVYTQIRDMATSPVDMSSTSTRSDGNSADRRSGTFTAAPSTSTGRTSMEVHAYAQPEFLTFPPRKDSDRSCASSSGSQSWQATAYAHSQQQDDIWNEFDDLMDDVMLPRVMTMPKYAAVPSAGQVTHLQQYVLPPLRGGPPTYELPLPPGAMSESAVVPTVLSVPEQVARFLQPSLSPLTPDTITAFVGGYETRSTSTLYSSNKRGSLQRAYGTSGLQPHRTSIASSRRTSIASSYDSRMSMHSRSSFTPQRDARDLRASFANSRTNRDSEPFDDAEASASIAKFRYGALMTSKWLSFGRILFSPGHNALAVCDHPRILVVDGLSSDWYRLVAQSYPDAKVYSLCPKEVNAQTEPWRSSSETQHDLHTGSKAKWKELSSPMPFPQDFFSVVIFRFPVATTEDAYRICISECKRVLRPGGFLEVAVLDLDLMNMGSRARRVIRDMKTGIQMRDQAVSLGNLSDVLLRLIGRRGFEEVQRCIVGIPAAGRIPSSVDGSSMNSNGSGRVSWDPEDFDHTAGDRNFADLLKNAGESLGPGTSNDEDITKMVAKIGRWWYTSCYERPYYPARRSIWRDRALLSECEAHGTSFRLLICHAQKPTQPRRRTVSV